MIPQDHPVLVPPMSPFNLPPAQMVHVHNWYKMQSLRLRGQAVAVKLEMLALDRMLEQNPSPRRFEF